MNPQCGKYQALLNEFVDQELDAPACQEMENHLSQCPGCQEQLKLLRLTCLAVQKLENPKAPADFLSKLRQKIDQQASEPAIGIWRSATSWLSAHPKALAATFSFVFAFAFVLGRFAPTVQLKTVNAEMEPAQAWKSAPAAGTTYNVAYRAATEEKAIPPSISEKIVSQPTAESSTPSLATPVSFSLLGATAPVETERPRVRVVLQTPTQLVINLVRRDPLFQEAAIYPIREGAVVQTETTVYRITISDQDFMNALRIISEQQALPASVDEAVKVFSLDVEKMPNPLK
jgi:anti-sigma factor RsiW